MKSTFLFVVCFLLMLDSLQANKIRVSGIGDYKKIENKILPGDTIELANGTWQDADLLITVNGKENAPIVFIAETPGAVLFSGNSKLRIGASYVEVNGINFVNGYTSKGAVIEFRGSSKELANYSRVTNCVIDNYNKPDRLSDDNWIAMYGKHNRFDHNYIANKKNLGTTLIVELNDLRNQENHHRIDHNYFGERPRLGSNGGETIRIGTSTYSRTTSATVVEENYFYQCNGEVEIVSVKSCDNILRRNTFFECEGGLVLRHGNRNTVNDNFFIGNNKPNTGGVRVINAGHRIFNNFFYQLAGERFRSALTILNGVPNSPINRYDPVKDVLIANNVFVECANIDLCAGKDLERTARPTDVLIAGNVFYNNQATLFTINDSINGIHFSGNISNNAFRGVPAKGFQVKSFPFKSSGETWLLQTPAKNYEAKYKAEIDQKLPGEDGQMPASFKPFANPANTGVEWYNSSDKKSATGKTWDVIPGENTLFEQVKTANAGDTLQLQSGTYFVDKVMEIKVPLTIRFKEQGANKPVLQFAGEKSGFTFFSIENGGSLTLQNVRFNGLSDNGTAESFIRSSLQPMIEHYSLYVDACDFENIEDGRKHAFKANKASYADTIQFTNCSFSQISGDAISVAAEKEDKGLYNAEYVIFRNCLFNKILLGAIDVYRGGNDESTTGPYFIMDHCVFNEIGNIELGYVIRLNGVQYSKITNTIFNNAGRAGRAIKYEDYGWTINSVDYCDLHITGKIESFYPNIVGSHMLKTDPQFINISNGNFQLKPTSPLLKKGSDKKDIGCIWKNGYLKFY